MSLAELAGLARDLAPPGRRAILGVTGPPGAGKTHLVTHILELLQRTPPAGLPVDEWVAHVPMDGFHLADVELERLGNRERKGAPDTFDSAGYLSILRRIRADDSEVVYAPGFERTLEQPIAASIPVLPTARLIITEGNYLLLPAGDWPKIRSLLDQVWYVDLDDEERQRRLIERHVRFGKQPEEASAWVRGPDQANAALVTSTREGADLVIATSDLAAEGRT